MPKFRVFDGPRVKTPKPICMNDSSKNPDFIKDCAFLLSNVIPFLLIGDIGNFVLKLYAKMQ